MRVRGFLRVGIISCFLSASPIIQAQTVLVALRVVGEPSRKEQLLELPQSDAEACVGEDVFAEIWATELNGKASGIAGGTVDILFDNKVLTPASIEHSNVFGTFTSGNLDTAMGRVESLGGATLESGVGEAPNWALLGRVRFDVIASGSTNLALEPGSFSFALAGGRPPLNFESEVQLDTPQAVGECSTVGVPFDIMPLRCPNRIKRNTNAAVWAALLGTEEFDITQVRTVGIELRRADGVGQALAPKNLKFKDEGTPFSGELCECHAVGKDGVTDLRMKFMTEAMVEAFELDDLPSGVEVELIVTGTLKDDTLFSGHDCILIMR